MCLLASTVFGAIWGAIPGIFKAYLNVNEVITAIMFNWIGLYGCNTIMYGRGTGAMYNAKQSKTFAVTGQSLIPSKLFGWDMTETFGYKSCTIAIFLAILVAILLYVVINKTTFGYELKACGCNKNAAKYAGIDEKRSIILSMIIAGALAGFGAGLYYLSGAAQWIPGDSTALPSEGFDGISVALLASSDPIAAIFSAIFISHISTGGGAVLRQQNVEALRQNGVLIWVKRPLCMLAVKNRPLSGKQGVENLYRARRKKYAAAADFAVNNGGTFARTLRKIEEKLNEYFGD